ncbi:NADH dehydrogenase subunit 5 [Bacillus swezeyi]|uniref:Probable inorganic carbon transporter subunit DabB n=1 Tax=Bacillus swezeyi TaxID=1925020 RepID=A0A1R1QLS3_9BACI|nr:NADH dehydrogenase subunit 5 [Bacillus swezeyi]MEC1262733.1 NADH dehydrogenase subunit 5 [Bacillus swezeyi]MED2928576.1 NADH dehydrogenase subunit 5 [Bacillus swezeyi]MED2945202.1 NADH dehydrogenase subunit 5 [Bacillus swezeyi]MED2962905.1 NADH dehydrogenase subunit 5 [Bacillus swezeyi]MED2975797.1 NADH dehydrogenase subunit 5 [Bacillus swezeyi]
MFDLVDSLFWLKIFFASLALCLFSALLVLNPKVPLPFVRIHAKIIALPPLAALAGMMTANAGHTAAPWRLDSLAWLIALFVLTIGFIVQRYSVRYLFGDRSYRKFFLLLTLTTGGASSAWINDDLRWLLFCWGITLLGLTALIGLNSTWQAAKNAALYAGRIFALSWLAIAAAALWLSLSTGHWQLSSAIAEESLAQLSSWEKIGIGLLVILTVMIPAAQWPFHRWLLDSAIAPTPVSAVMHAGLVNVGGVMLTRFAPMFSGDALQLILLVPAVLSVLLGTGMMLVQTDYKRQLAASTVAQMGFMLIQCALGAYIAAVIHLVLHGLFKAALFLQAGSAVRRYESFASKPGRPSLFWNILGGVFALILVTGIWVTAADDGYQMISALVLGWSLFVAWRQLVTAGHGLITRIAGLFILTGASLAFAIIHFVLHGLLKEAVVQGAQPPAIAVVLTAAVLLFGSAAGALIVRQRFAWSGALYLHLVKTGEPHSDSVERRPNYLDQYLTQGGRQG